MLQENKWNLLKILYKIYLSTVIDWFKNNLTFFLLALLWHFLNVDFKLWIAKVSWQTEKWMRLCNLQKE